MDHTHGNNKKKKNRYSHFGPTVCPTHTNRFYSQIFQVQSGNFTKLRDISVTTVRQVNK